MDWQPAWRPANAITFTTTAAVEGGDALELTGPYLVAPAAASSTKYIGIAAHSAAGGEQVLVHLLGKSIQRGRAGGAIAVGDKVATGAGGDIVTASTNPSIGLALTATTAADQTVEFID